MSPGRSSERVKVGKFRDASARYVAIVRLFQQNSISPLLCSSSKLLRAGRGLVVIRRCNKPVALQAAADCAARTIQLRRSISPIVFFSLALTFNISVERIGPQVKGGLVFRAVQFEDKRCPGFGTEPAFLSCSFTFT